ncbi:glycosyl transferase [Lentibacillus halophilus]|uniref:Glycosyl transferase n=1 Tax=Lentibacillus halophilus TaxID=295065 RepID=A0ABP3J9S5_9BACI
METKNALFLPFMQIPTGHHHVADALMETVQSIRADMACEKVDILSYSYGNMEKAVSSAYLNWIKFFPGVYDRLYRLAACKEQSLHRRNRFYEAMFLYFFKRLVTQHDPHILISTHALPSNLASSLKLKNRLRSITVNAYTDFFINDVWGIDAIDYHLVPTAAAKTFLVKNGVSEERVLVTGVPIHPVFQAKEFKAKTAGTIKVLVTGGSLGAGLIRKLLSSLSSEAIHYYVLCGKNESLHRELLSKQFDNVTPIPYIDHKAEMNAIYDRIDAVLTKPGGVTISECLMKQKPIFMYAPLPGQEKINARELNRLGVAMMVDLHNNPEQEIVRFFGSQREQENYRKQIHDYHRQLEDRPLSELLVNILNNRH